MKRYVIIGGVAGGATAAARLRRLDEDAKITIIERGASPSFAGCGLPYYVGSVIGERDRLLVMTPEKFQKNFAIDVLTETEATAIDTKERSVRLRKKDGAEETIPYDSLLLSPGGKGLRPRIPGIDSPRIHELRTIPDADTLRPLAQKGRRAVVIGGGFIGVEAAENLHAAGCSVTLLEAADHILAPFDPDMVCYLERELTLGGIDLQLGDGGASFAEEGDALAITLQSGKRLTADFAVLAIGVTPDTAFLEGSDIERNERGYIKVDEHMRTSVPEVYAVGDAVETRDQATGVPATLALAGPANRQAHIAADNIAGIPTTYGGVSCTSILKVAGLTGAATGKNERQLEREGLAYGKDYFIALLHPFSHVTYYPGAQQMVLKLLFHRDGRILGAQIIGRDGIKARIDTIATALRLGGTVADLAALELSYAPPFGGPKDPVNLAGYIAENIRSGLVSFTRVSELEEAQSKGARLVDVREPAELAAGAIEGVTNIPLGTLRDRYKELDASVPWIVVCRVGQRAYNGARFLKSRGYNVTVLMGGMLSYRAERGKHTNPASEKNGGSTASQEKKEPEDDSHKGPVPVKVITLNGLACPGPVLALQKAVEALAPGEVIELQATDDGFYEDSRAWCQSTGNRLLLRERKDGKIRVQVQKAAPLAATTAMPAAPAPKSRDKTILVFSGDLDKALAAFIIANGAAATGAHVTMFFTFWGLSALRKANPPQTKKNFLARMFSAMLPKGAAKLPLSKLHMGGLGTSLMKHIMREHNVLSLEELIKTAQAAGVEMIACQMTMDLMGIQKEELIDGITIGGVASFLEKADQSSVTLRF